jgi:DNA-binding NtrC family response regulator
MQIEVDSWPHGAVSIAGDSSALRLWKPGRTLADVERDAILEAFRWHGGNRTRTARALDISVRCLRYKLKLWKKAGHAV